MTEKDLLDILNNLRDDEFKDFKWHLKYEKVGDIPPIKGSQLWEAERRDVVDLMVQKYELAGAVEVIKSVLKNNRNDLVRKLLNISSGAKDQERVLQRKFHTISLPPGELHLTWSRTNLPQNPKPTDQPSICHSQIEHLQNVHLQCIYEEQKIHISDKIRQAGGAGEKLLYHKTTQDSCDSSMTTGFNSRFAGQNERKISIVVLGTEDNLKKSLISLITGKDVSVHRNTQNKTETYENDTYEVIYTPNLYEASEEIKKLFSSKHPDMSVLVLKDKISTQEVWHQMDNLHKTIEKLTDEFIAVLPLRYKYEESHLFKFCTTEHLIRKLRELAEDRRLMPTNERQKRSAEQPNSQMETDEPQSVFAAFYQRPVKFVRYIIELFSDTKQSLKGNHSDNKVNLVLLGMSGTGKSASGNTILGRRQFVSRTSSVPVTTECQVEETEINGTCVCVIDTPDIFDDEIESSVKSQRVTKCKELLQSEPCVFLLVIHVGRFTDGERDILEKLGKAFGSEAKEQTVILFTRGEELQRADMNLEDFLQDCQPELMNIVDQCGRRCVVFENKTPHQHQVTELMQTVKRMLNK
ncbi:uncharacterized protein LOC122972247 [Thunnus albacares]|uniref:uncharacterized protein LOC122972247 n=1 Tax=Thunnus albacares TaxID=8236 RepID=UPI001CF7118C|nr:uncharacterized protein LOC122972247 [Thunnus albacares]